MALAVSNFASNIPAPINNVYMRGLLRAARKVLPFFNGTVPGELEKTKGSATVKWRRIENLAKVSSALSELSAGATVAFGIGRTAVNPTITDITKAVAKYGNAIMTTEEVDLFQINSKTMDFVETLGANAGESLNDFMRVEMDNASLVRRGGGVANESAIVSSISAADIQWTVNALNRRSAMKHFSQGTGSRNIGTSPVRTSYYGICHSDVEEDIRGLTNFLGVEQYAGYTETLVGEFGAIGGVRWVSSEIAPIETGSGQSSASGFRNSGGDTSNDIYTSYVYGREAVGSIGLGEQYGTDVTKMYDNKLSPIEIIHKAPGSSGIGDMFNEVGSLAWKAWFAGKILNDDWIVKVRTLATAL